MRQGRAATFPSGPLTLEGVLHLPAETPGPGLAVCHPHPMYGGEMHNNVVTAICESAVENGIAALRFNFRGAGGSEGKYDNGIGEQDDVRAALAYLRAQPEIDSERIALAGYSFGAAVAVRAASSDTGQALSLTDPLSCLVAVSTPTSMTLQGINLVCPALFVSGDEDEYSDAGELTAFVRDLGPQAELKLLPGLGHFWFGVEQDLAAIVAEFLKEHVTATTSV